MIIDLSMGPLDPDQPTADYWSELMRAHRDRLLAESDWTQMPDSPLSDDERAAWAEYRQQLRDAPANWVPAATWDAPDPPD